MFSLSDKSITLHSLVDVFDQTDASPVILHAPHAGFIVPSPSRSEFMLDDAQLALEHQCMIDHATDEMVRVALEGATASAVVNKLSRLVVDVERFDSEQEEMNQVGMGVLYTHSRTREHMRDLPQDVSEYKRFFHDYSAAITELTDRALARHGRAIILDIHSYSSARQEYELHGDAQRPQLCVGYEDFHLASDIRQALRESFDWLEQSDNEVFRGAYVPLKHYRADARVQSVMLEIRRDQYMDAVPAAITGDDGEVNFCAVERFGQAIGRVIHRLDPEKESASSK